MNIHDNPVYVFHHIPKCGGNSVIEMLDNWFVTVRDYRVGRTMVYPDKVDINAMESSHCLCGHFELDGFYLHQRYPEVFMSGMSKFRVIAFIRDPLQVQLSLFRYERKYGVSKSKNIKEHLVLRPNYLSKRFPAREDNYKEIIDRYFFVGILEDAQNSIDILADKIGKKTVPLAYINKTQGAGINEIGDQELSETIINKFKRDNSLDYHIYNYCVDKFNNIRDKMHKGTSST